MHQLLPLSPSESLSRSRKSPVIRFLLERTGERNACTQTRLALLVAPTASSATCTYTCTCILTYLRFSPRIPLSLFLFARAYCLYVLLQIFSLRQTFVHLKSASPYFLDASRVYAFLLRERPTGQPGSFAKTFSQLLCFSPLLLSHGFQDFRWFAQTRSIVQQSAINSRTINRLMIERTVPMLMLGSHDVFDRRFNRSSWR